MSDFKTSYTDMLAALYWDIEVLLAEYNERALLSPAACECMWKKFEALRQRLAQLKAGAMAGPVRARHPASHEDVARSFLSELEMLLDVDHEGADWETYMGAAMIHAERRICDEARWVERLS